MFEIGVRITFGLDERTGKSEANDSLLEKFKSAAELGIYSCQLNMWSQELFTDESAELIKKVSKETGVKVSALWAGWSGPCEWNFNVGPEVLGLVPPAYRAKRTEELIAASEFAEKIGVTDIITHCGFIPENPNDPNFMGVVGALRKICGVMKNRGQYFLFETGQETPVAMMRCFEKVGRDNLGVNLDTANLILYGKANPVDALDVLGKYVRNLHAKDGLYPVNGHDLGAETKIGEGKVDFKGVISKLHSLGYCGHITIEREIEGEQQTKDILESKKYLQKIVDEVCK